MLAPPPEVVASRCSTARGTRPAGRLAACLCGAAISGLPLPHPVAGAARATRRDIACTARGACRGRRPLSEKVKMLRPQCVMRPRSAARHELCQTLRRQVRLRRGLARSRHAGCCRLELSRGPARGPSQTEKEVSSHWSKLIWQCSTIAACGCRRPPLLLPPPRERASRGRARCRWLAATTPGTASTASPPLRQAAGQ